MCTTPAILMSASDAAFHLTLELGAWKSGLASEVATGTPTPSRFGVELSRRMGTQHELLLQLKS